MILGPFIVPIWFLFGIAAAIAASNRGRSGLGWFFLGVLLGPFGLLFALLLKPPKDKVTERILLDQFVSPRDIKTCPMCAEEVKIAALKCKHCGHQFDPEQVAQDVTTYEKDVATYEMLTDPRYCPRCKRFDVTQAFLGDGSFGPWCPNCKLPVFK